MTNKTHNEVILDAALEGKAEKAIINVSEIDVTTFPVGQGKTSLAPILAGLNPLFDGNIRNIEENITERIMQSKAGELNSGDYALAVKCLYGNDIEKKLHVSETLNKFKSFGGSPLNFGDVITAATVASLQEGDTHVAYYASNLPLSATELQVPTSFSHRPCGDEGLDNACYLIRRVGSELVAMVQTLAVGKPGRIDNFVFTITKNNRLHVTTNTYATNLATDSNTVILTAWLLMYVVARLSGRGLGSISVTFKDIQKSIEEELLILNVRHHNVVTLSSITEPDFINCISSGDHTKINWAMVDVDKITMEVDYSAVVIKDEFNFKKEMCKSVTKRIIAPTRLGSKLTNLHGGSAVICSVVEDLDKVESDNMLAMFEGKLEDDTANSFASLYLMAAADTDVKDVYFKYKEGLNTTSDTYMIPTLYPSTSEAMESLSKVIGFVESSALWISKLKRDLPRLERGRIHDWHFTVTDGSVNVYNVVDNLNVTRGGNRTILEGWVLMYVMAKLCMLEMGTIHISFTDIKLDTRTLSNPVDLRNFNYAEVTEQAINYKFDSEGFYGGIIVGRGMTISSVRID